MGRIHKIVYKKLMMYYDFMIILAIDSSQKDLSLSLKVDENIITKTYQKDGKHSEIFLEVVSEILDKNSIRLPNLSGILFNKGPASFTGTRVAASSLQAIGYSLNIPVIGISSLEVMSHVYSIDSNERMFDCAKYAYGDKYFSASFEKIEKLIQINDTELADIEMIDTSHKKHLIINTELSEYLQKKGLPLTLNNTVLPRETNSEDLISFAEKYINICGEFNLSDTLPDYANHEI